jgi:hypothetical protein
MHAHRAGRRRRRARERRLGRKRRLPRDGSRSTERFRPRCERIQLRGTPAPRPHLLAGWDASGRDASRRRVHGDRRPGWIDPCQGWLVAGRTGSTPDHRPSPPRPCLCASRARAGGLRSARVSAERDRLSDPGLLARHWNVRGRTAGLRRPGDDAAPAVRSRYAKRRSAVATRSTSSSLIVPAKGSASARAKAASAPGNEPRSR